MPLWRLRLLPSHRADGYAADMQESAALSPTCPRCGYDLGGAVASWVREGDGASCPTDGVCSECGYALLWRDILNPIYQRLPGFYEHARTRRERIAWGWRTTLWLIFPLVFWGKVKLHHTKRPLRAIRLAAWMIGISLLMRAMVAGVGFIVLSYASVIPRPVWSQAPNNGWSFFDCCFGPRMTWSEIGAWTGNAGWAIEVMSPTSFATWQLAPLSFSISMMALILWAMPATRRYAKLRSAHVWRAAAYVLVPTGLSALASAAFACAVMVENIWSGLNGGRSGNSLYFPLWLLIVGSAAIAMPLWHVAFWWSAIIRAWQLRHGVATCILLSVAAGIVAVITASLLFLACYGTERFGAWIITF